MVHKIGIIFLAALCASCNRDIENARIYGSIVNKKTQKPLKGLTLTIEAAYYRGGDHDSYNGYQKIYLLTDSNGKFDTVFPRAAYVQIIMRRLSGDTLLYESDVLTKTHEVEIKL